MDWHPVISVQQTPDNDFCHFSISNVRFAFWAFFKNRKNSGLTPGQNDDPVTRTWKMTQTTHWPGDPVTQFHVWWAVLKRLNRSGEVCHLRLRCQVRGAGWSSGDVWVGHWHAAAGRVATTLHTSSLCLGRTGPQLPRLDRTSRRVTSHTRTHTQTDTHEATHDDRSLAETSKYRISTDWGSRGIGTVREMECQYSGSSREIHLRLEK